MIFVRIDNRLVHGQILEAWIPFIKASRILVVNDVVARDVFRETVIKMSVPRDIEVIVYSVKEFPGHIFEENDSRNTIVLFDNVKDSLRAYKSGFQFDRLNIGNVYCGEEGKFCCAASVSLSKEDIVDIMQLVDAGVEVELRCMPKDKLLDFTEVMKGITF